MKIRLKNRIPRKLKKAAKYGVDQYENKISPITLVLNYRERVKFVVVGRRTKWKLKACSACAKEEKNTNCLHVGEVQ